MNLNVINRNIARGWLLVAGLLLLPWTGQAGFFDGFYCYETDSGITIQAYYGSEASVTIPSEVGSLPVTTIGVNAFAYNEAITNVVIPSSVTMIESAAFQGCSNLLSVALGTNLTQIDYAAFEFCSQLERIALPNSLTYIDAEAFAYCTNLSTATFGSNISQIGSRAFTCTRLQNLVIPKGVLGIGDTAFGQCTSLTNVTLADSVTNIEDDAFSACERLANVQLGKGVTHIGTQSFSGTKLSLVAIPASATSLSPGLFAYCEQLLAIEVDPLNPNYTSIDGILFTRDLVTLLAYPAAKVGGYAIPNTVRTIADYAMSLATSLDGVSIPTTVTNIGSQAFAWSYNLTNVTIPSTVITIGRNSFSYCSSLTDIFVDPQNPAFSSSDGVLFNKSGSLLLEFPAGKAGAYSIPAAVTNLQENAFEGCQNLTSIVIPENLTNLGTSIFWDSFSLTNISVSSANPVYSSVDGVLFNKDKTQLIECPDGRTGTYSLPKTVTTIGEYAFAPCMYLTGVDIPTSVTNIENSAFYYCIALTNIQLPASITTLGFGVFGFCSNLAGIYFCGDAPNHYYWEGWNNPNTTVYYKTQTKGWSDTFLGFPTAPWPAISAQTVSNTVVLKWSQGTLLETTNLATGPWTNNSAAKSPYSIDLDSPRKFYKLKLDKI